MILYIYYFAKQAYNNNWTMFYQEFDDYLNYEAIQDARFADFFDEEEDS